MKYGKVRKCQNHRVLYTITQENINRGKRLLLRIFARIKFWFSEKTSYVLSDRTFSQQATLSKQEFGRKVD
jgi:hypothetical protein